MATRLSLTRLRGHNCIGNDKHHDMIRLKILKRVNECLLKSCEVKERAQQWADPAITACVEKTRHLPAVVDPLSVPWDQTRMAAISRELDELQNLYDNISNTVNTVILGDGQENDVPVDPALFTTPTDGNPIEDAATFGSPQPELPTQDNPQENVAIFGNSSWDLEMDFALEQPDMKVGLEPLEMEVDLHQSQEVGFEQSQMEVDFEQYEMEVDFEESEMETDFEDYEMEPDFEQSEMGIDLGQLEMEVGLEQSEIEIVPEQPVRPYLFHAYRMLEIESYVRFYRETWKRNNMRLYEIQDRKEQKNPGRMEVVETGNREVIFKHRGAPSPLSQMMSVDDF